MPLLTAQAVIPAGLVHHAALHLEHHVCPYAFVFNLLHIKPYIISSKYLGSGIRCQCAREFLLWKNGTKNYLGIELLELEKLQQSQSNFVFPFG